jgi:hypothetical protein
MQARVRATCVTALFSRGAISCAPLPTVAVQKEEVAEFPIPDFGAF